MDTNNKWIKSFLKWKCVQEILGDGYDLNSDEAKRLSLVAIAYPSTRELGESHLKNLAFMIKYNLNNYIGRIKRLKKCSASPTLYSLILRYGKNEAIIRKQLYGVKRTRHFQNTQQYWIDRGFDPKSLEVKQHISNVQKLSASFVDVENQKKTSKRCKIYWMNCGYSEEEAKIMVSKQQHTFSLKKCIEKFGVDDGMRVWSDRQEKWQATLSKKTEEQKYIINLKRGHSIESYIARGYSLEDAKKESIAFYKKRNNFSLISQKLFDMITSNLPRDETFFYKLFNHEMQISGKNVDFYHAESKTVIEFFGDFWHRNPTMYTEDSKLYGLETAKIWENDERRIKKILTNNLVENVIIIWENVFITHTQKTVDCLCNLLMENRKNVEQARGNGKTVKIIDGIEQL